MTRATVLAFANTRKRHIAFSRNCANRNLVDADTTLETVMLLLSMVLVLELR